VSAKASLAALQQALPEREWRAVEAWLWTFFPFQLNWLLDFSRSALLVKSRRIGGTYTYAGAIALWGMLGEPTNVVSRGDAEAHLILGFVEKHATALARLGSEWLRPAKAKYLVGDVLSFRSGGTVIAHPASNPARGYDGNLILDEFAYHHDPRAVWDAAAPSSLHGWKRRILSTPNGASGMFYDFAEKDLGKHYTKHRVGLRQAQAAGMLVSEADQRDIDLGDPRLHEQLFECSFIDSAEQYIPTGLIEAASVEPIYTTESEPAYGGLDIGRTADLTCLVIVRVGIDGIARVVHIETLGRTDTADLDRLAYDACVTWGVKRLCIDSTGMGSFPAADIKKRYGQHRVECVDFTQASKEDMATSLRGHLFARTLKLPPDAPELRRDLCSLRRLVTSAGNIRYDAPQTAAGHADRAWALALALHGFAKPLNYRTETV
jgi:phage FluMu gp28-like protein